MNSRERYVETLTFGRPDRVPFEPGRPRESTLRRWHGEGLPPDGHWFEHLCGHLGIEPPRTRARIDPGVDFRMIPQFTEEVLDRRDGHLIVRDWKGNVCEISDEYDVSYLRQAKDFVTRRWIRCPVEGREDFERMKLRYDPQAPGRFPEDFSDRCRRLHDRDWPLRVSFPGPFWQMREWCGFEGLCVLMVEDPEFVDEMARFWTDFVQAVLERMLAELTPDELMINEDMAYKQHSMISPAMTRRFCKPSYDRWFPPARSGGVKVITMDCDGYVGELLGLWMESGINCCFPMEVAAGNDILACRKDTGRRVAFLAGVDKRAIAAGGQTIRDELRRVEPVIADGGYIPGCDHGVPADISWPDFVDYADLLARMTG
ncbi:MAG: uroporphyrinogen decarboxylase family protein [Phycisphaerae bacterium]